MHINKTWRSNSSWFLQIRDLAGVGRNFSSLEILLLLTLSLLAIKLSGWPPSHVNLMLLIHVISLGIRSLRCTMADTDLSGFSIIFPGMPWLLGWLLWTSSLICTCFPGRVSLWIPLVYSVVKLLMSEITFVFGCCFSKQVRSKVLHCCDINRPAGDWSEEFNWINWLKGKSLEVTVL